MMKCIFVIVAGLVACSALPSQATQNEPQRYRYHVWGTVKDSQSRAMSGASVCFVPAERPINGRIPCAKTDGEGEFALTVKDVPDKYKVCASDTDTPFILEGDRAHRATCSEVIEFGAGDECKEVTLRFNDAD